MKAKSIQGISAKEVKSALEQSMADGFRPTLAIVFLSIKQDRETIRQLLDKNRISIFGATSAGEFTEKGVEKESIAMLLLDINPAYFKIVLEDHENGSAIESGKRLGEKGKAFFQNPAFIISGSHLDTPGEYIIKGLVQAVGKDANIIGGMAGDVNTMLGSVVFTNNFSSKKGAIALIIDEDKIELKGVAVSGWKAVGTEKTITKAEGSWIYTVDGNPAMDLISKFTGIEVDKNNQNDVFAKVGSFYPLQIIQKEGNPVMRPPFLFNKKDKSVMCGGIIEQGSKFRFSLPPDFDVIDVVIESAATLKENHFPEADALLIFSCIGRLATLGPMASDELEGLAKTWGAPMAGFFSMGEFGRVNGGYPDFHGTTCSWVAIKEK